MPLGHHPIGCALPLADRCLGFWFFGRQRGTSEVNYPVERDTIAQKLMKLLKLLPVIAGASFLFWTGCGNPASRVKVSSASPAASGQQTSQIEIFDVGEAPEKPFRE